MKITKNWGPAKYPVHFCLLDKDCREAYRMYYSPIRLYLHFLQDKEGHGVWIDVWGKRRHQKWFNSLDWEPSLTKEEWDARKRQSDQGSESVDR